MGNEILKYKWRCDQCGEYEAAGFYCECTTQIPDPPSHCLYEGDGEGDWEKVK